MLFVTLHKWKKKPTKETLELAKKIFMQEAKDGGKTIAQYWTLGRYDIVSVFEAPDEKTAMKGLIRGGDLMTSETLVAVPREEAIELVE